MSAPAHMVVRCSGIGEDGPCGREQAIESHDGGTGIRVASEICGEQASWLASFGWRHQNKQWLCPFCAARGDLS